MFFLNSQFRLIRADKFNDISVGASCHNRTLVIESSVPFEIAVIGLEDQFTPSIVNKDLKIVRDKKCKNIKLLIGDYRTSWPEGRWCRNYRFTCFGYVS